MFIQQVGQLLQTREELAEAIKPIDMFLAMNMEHMQPEIRRIIKEKIAHKEIGEMEERLKTLGEKMDKLLEKVDPKI